MSIVEEELEFAASVAEGEGAGGAESETTKKNGMNTWRQASRSIGSLTAF